jgi:phosphocarrier protein HPr
MTEREVVVGHRLGLHARAAARVVQLANQFQSSIALRRNDQGKDVEADARSILSILFLAAAHGATLMVRADGTDENDAVNSICEYLKG